VPHWTTCLVQDLDRAADFYGRVMGWDFDISPDDGYAVATLRGREVAGLGTVTAALPAARPGWITEVCVDDATAAAEAVIRAGGSVLAGPLDLSPASVLTVVTDPAGAVLCATQPVGRRGAELVNEPGAWTMSALSTPDPSAVAAFYRDLFGWEAEQFGPMTLWRLPAYVGGEPSQPVPRDVIAVAQSSDGASRWDVDFRIADADAAARAARDAGGAVVAEPANQDSIPFRRAVLADPDGAVFSVSQLLL
jgi:predicted enzyme related to lactoylglutathione lyase